MRTYLGSVGKLLLVGALAAVASPALAVELLMMNVTAPEKTTGQDTTVALFSFEGTSDAQGRLVAIDAQINSHAVHVSIDELRQKPVTISLKGISFMTIQSLGLNAMGEGTVRLMMDSKFVGDPSVAYFDAQLVRIGPKKTWTTTRNGQVLKQANMRLSYNPQGASPFSLMLSPPKVTATTFTPFGCNIWDALAVVERFESIDPIKATKCKLSIDSVNMQLLSQMIMQDDLLRQYYMFGIGPAAANKKALTTLQLLEQIGADYSALAKKLAKDPAAVQNILVSSVNNGYKSVFEFLVSKGFVPKDDELLLDALKNSIQYDVSKKKLVGSPTARAMAEVMLSVGAKTTIDDVVSLSAFTASPDSVYQTPLSKGETEDSRRYEHVKLIAQLGRALNLPLIGEAGKGTPEEKFRATLDELGFSNAQIKTVLDLATQPANQNQ